MYLSFNRAFLHYYLKKLVDRKANKFPVLAKIYNLVLYQIYDIRLACTYVPYARTAVSASGEHLSCGKHVKERKRSRIVHHCRGSVFRKCITFTCTSPYRLKYRILRKDAMHSFARSIPRAVRDMMQNTAVPPPV